MTTLHVGILIASFFTAPGCSQDHVQDDATPAERPEVSKTEARQAKADGTNICTKLGYAADCDVCSEAGWYGDGECDSGLIADGLCAGPDPDCPANPGPDSCSGVICDSPPEAPYCESRRKRVLYSGKCRSDSTGPKCEYSLQSDDCPFHVCENGACVDTAGRIDFGTEGSPVLSGSVSAGAELTVVYTMDRLIKDNPQCKRSLGPYGFQAMVWMGIRFNSDETRVEAQRVVDYATTGDFGHVDRSDPILVLPDDLNQVELWFYCTDVDGNKAYDSNWGANYVYSPD
jgi:hypothetical protein